MGDPAVAPLLEVLESDNRLTRSVSNGRGISLQHFVHPVYEAAFAALIGILKTGSSTTAPLRVEEHDPARGRPSRPRSASSGRRRARSRWSSGGTGPCSTTRPGRPLAGGGRGIVQPDVPEGDAVPQARHPANEGGVAAGRAGPERHRPDAPPGPADRADGRLPGVPRPGVSGACQMGSILAPWDEKASLPLLKHLTNAAGRPLAREPPERRPDRVGQNSPRSGSGWRCRGPRRVCRLAPDDHPEDAGIWNTPGSAAAPGPSRSSGAGVGRAVAVQRPEVSVGPAPPRSPGGAVAAFQNLFASPLIVVAGFRQGVLAGLADKTPLGTVERVDDRPSSARSRTQSTNYSSSNLDLEGIRCRRGLSLPSLRLPRLEALGPRGLPADRPLLARGPPRRGRGRVRGLPEAVRRLFSASPCPASTISLSPGPT